MSKSTILEDYTAELKYALEMKESGVLTVRAAMAGTNADVSIDEYIAKWQNGIDAMNAGADPELFNY